MNDILDALFITLSIMSPICIIWVVVDGYVNRRGIWGVIDKLENKPTTNFYIISENTQINTDTYKNARLNGQK